MILSRQRFLDMLISLLLLWKHIKSSHSWNQDPHTELFSRLNTGYAPTWLAGTQPASSVASKAGSSLGSLRVALLLVHVATDRCWHFEWAVSEDYRLPLLHHLGEKWQKNHLYINIMTKRVYKHQAKLSLISKHLQVWPPLAANFFVIFP